MLGAVKTRKELLAEFRNMIALRQIEREANAAYFKMISKTTKSDTQERVDALNNVANNEILAKKDGDFLKCIDEMLEK